VVVEIIKPEAIEPMDVDLSMANVFRSGIVELKTKDGNGV
jgi:uncharacterized protein YrrD